MKHSFSGKIIKFLLRQQKNYCGFEQRHFGLNSAELRKKNRKKQIVHCTAQNKRYAVKICIKK